MLSGSDSASHDILLSDVFIHAPEMYFRGEDLYEAYQMMKTASASISRLNLQLEWDAFHTDDIDQAKAQGSKAS